MKRRATQSTLGRRSVLALGAGAALCPSFALAATAREISWDDLIPPGVPYGEIIGEGEIDIENDTWRPVFDANGSKLNALLEGETIRLPGFVIPLDIGAAGVTSFLLVPYVGACIHTPPPPPNQLVFVATETPWPSDDLWDPVWVTGVMRTGLQSTQIADIGYRIRAEKIEIYVW